MALMCVACRTENRDAAKFCKGCGGKLVSLPSRSAAEEEALEDAWGATLHASLVDESGRSTRARGPSHRASRPSALLSAAAEPASQPQRIDTARQQLPVTRDRSVRWVMLAALAIIVATGGAYVYRGLHPRSASTVALPQANESVAAPTNSTPAAVTSAPEPVTVPVVEVTTPEAPAPMSTEVESPAAPLPSASSPAAPTASADARRPPPRKPPVPSTSSVLVPPVSVAPAASAVSVSTPVAPPAPADPSQTCAGRNFIATAQCLAAQCAQAEFTAHARCDAVRRQQQIEEEKRNPVNAG